MDLQLFSIFVAVADAGSFTEAARRLGTTKASISRAVAKLEAEVGAELIHRTTRNLALSTAGTALYERAAPHVGALRKVVGTLPERETLPSGELRITAPIDFGTICLPEVIARFVLRYPDVRLDVQLTNEFVDLVSGGFDLAIRVASPKLKDSTLTKRGLAPLSMAAYAAPSYVARRGTPREVGDPDHDWALHPAVTRMFASKRNLVPKVTSNDLLFLRDLLRTGMHAGVLPAFVGDPEVAGGTLVRVMPLLKVKLPELVLLYPSSGQVARKVSAFRDVLIETLRTRPLPS